MRLLPLVLFCGLVASGFAAAIQNDVSPCGVVTEAPAQSPCDPVTEAPTQPPCDPVSEAPTTESPCQVTEAPAQPPCDPVTEAPTEPPCQEPTTTTTTTTEAPAQPPCAAAATEAPTKAPCPYAKKNIKSQKRVRNSRKGKSEPANPVVADDYEDDDGYILVPKKQNATEPPKECKTWNKCFNNDDCAGGKGGTCIGASIGTCHCYSCVHFYPCTSDLHCGGFKNACNLEKGECDCYGAYKKNGLKSFGQALLNFCGIQKCTADGEDTCFGLPCQAGKCICN
ncbi:hypothetical protein QR680_004707 [Steinernema hermaphroditum]|uniref:EB domain-containing protein n=1 Tax=Steinernema hermaphroditum TaxID=289476 RepID=A0AA39LUE9_9BILA|nr:hypothetical protein QR680_004707 [Steinernema hermaphroditum]